VQQVERQPSHVYTLHLASFRKRGSLLSFLKRQWLGKHLNRRRIYKTIPKELSFFTSGDIATRNDAVYSKRVVAREQRLTRLCYGVYESVADANADKRVLERYLKLRIRVIREQLTTEFIRRACYEPIGGTRFTKWQQWEMDS